MLGFLPRDAFTLQKPVRHAPRQPFEINVEWARFARISCSPELGESTLSEREGEPQV